MRIRFLFLFILLTARLQAQPGDDAVLTSLHASLRQYASSIDRPDLFLHIDKTIYVPQESIWLTAYVLNKATIAEQHTLHTVLVEEATKKIWASERFLLRDGIAKGTLLLPDSISPGEYRLLAFTNSRLTHPSQPAFQQSITIRRSESKTFQLSFLPSLVSFAPDDSVRFKYKVLTGYGGLASKGEFSYLLFADGQKLQSAKKDIDAFGEVSFSLLKNDAWNKKLKLVATISRGNEKQDFQAAVPLFEDVAFVRLYPESGHLVLDHPARIALEIKNGLGVPIAIKGQLLEDNVSLTSFTTDQYGNAVLPLTPLPGKSYAIQLEGGYKHVVCDSFRIDREGFTLRVDKPVVTDSLFQLEILAPDTGLCHLLVHDYRNTFFSAKLRLNKKRSVLSLPAVNIPEGIATVTLFDAVGNPRAERAVYVPQRLPVNVAISIDTSATASSGLSSFGKRQPLFVTVSTTNALGQPVKSRFSMACVLSSRLDSARMPDIMRFQNFDRFLPAATAMPGSQYLAKAANIEMLLLTKFWTKYKWNELKSVALPETQESFCDAGDLYYKGRRVKEQVNLMISSDDHTYPISTDSIGHFDLPPNYLMVRAGSRVSILVMNKKNFRDYTIHFYNRCQVADTLVAMASHPDASFPKAELSVEEQRHLKGAMKAVVVTKKIDDGIYRSTSCNDFVCPSNILNCTFHKAGRRPVNGESYIYLKKNSLMSVGYMPTVIYRGECGIDTAQTGFMKKVKGISYEKEFYIADYVQHAPPQPDMRSTVSWTYLQETNEAGKAIVTFPTNDLAGRFVCILQGVSDEGAISAKAYFNVVD